MVLTQVRALCLHPPMAEGITMTEAHVSEIGHLASQEARMGRGRACFLYSIPLAKTNQGPMRRELPLTSSKGSAPVTSHLAPPHKDPPPPNITSPTRASFRCMNL